MRGYGNGDLESRVSRSMIGVVEVLAMHVPYCRLTVRKTMASIVVFGVCLATIRLNYRARLYGDTSVVKILSVAERTPECMSAHARRLVSPEILSHASLDPRLSGLHRPLRAGDREEVIGSSPGPQVYAHVDSVEDGTLWVDAIAEGSAVEATSIARAVTVAYIADQGANRVVPWTAGIPMGCEFQPKPLAEPWELAAAVALAVLASALALDRADQAALLRAVDGRGRGWCRSCHCLRWNFGTPSLQEAKWSTSWSALSWPGRSPWLARTRRRWRAM